jgi:alpha-L-fucosidase
MRYEPTWASVRQHEVPAWFHDAKLGIFVHWGLYSVPGWAPTTGELGKVVAEQGWEAWFARNPYAEWYYNSMRIPGGVTQAYHAETYGADFAYENFIPMFNNAVADWDPGEWASLFKQVGAQYVVLTTKHHDGFLLWPSAHPNPLKAGYHAERDLVGDLTDAVRAAGMRMALYYSGGIDWTFNPTVVTNIADLVQAVPQQDAYVAYADAHWYELIEWYAPVILWNDIAYPAAADLAKLFAHYYNAVPEGLVNNRFTQAFSIDPDAMAIEGGLHFDFTTPEYASYDKITEPKWEATRGIGFSFGYNRNEDVTAYLSVEDLVRSFVDVVSKNGNLLLNVGPMADGTIPALQRERLEGLGAWLDVHGGAIFGTRPWVTAEGTACTDAQAEVPVRFTQKPDTLYATLLADPEPGTLVLKGLQAAETARITLMGSETSLAWQQTDEGVRLTVSGPLPASLDGAPASTVAITPRPQLFIP